MASRIIPERVTELSMCEVFVFGSNLAGQHYGGAARTAHDKFGAEWGVGVGPTGQCYAIPTMQGGIDTIRPYVDEFTEYARNHPNNRFLVTRIGCGIAGFKDDEIAPLFYEASKLPNVNFSKEWLNILSMPDILDAFCGCPPVKKPAYTPEVVTIEDLKRLCDEYKYIIGARIMGVPLPDITIRYVIDENRFGYVKFGDFFIYESNDLYVWTRKEEFRDGHNQYIVEEYFGDECKGRGFCHRFLYAGVKTPYRDSNGDVIYTGDVLRVMLGEKHMPVNDDVFNKEGYVWAFDTLGQNEGECKARYAFVLDNHCATPNMIARWERIGTVYYQLDWNLDVEDMVERCRYFQDIYCQGPSLEDKLVLARYTPNFNKEVWKYYGLEALGVEEYDWKVKRQ